MEEEVEDRRSQSLEQDLPTTPTLGNGSREKFPTYKKLKGTIDEGREYEQMMSGYYALTLAVNDEVKDFEMSSNNMENGKFDDIGLNVTFRDGKSRPFLFQLKHKDNKNKNIIVADLKSEKQNSDFGVKTYISSITEKRFDEDTICIIYTNCSAKIKGNESLTDGITIEQCDRMEFQEFFLNTKTDCKNAIFEVKSENLKQKFYFFTSQLNAKSIEEQLNAKLKNLLQCNIHAAFIKYMKDWWSGRLILTKHDVIFKITELAFSPYLETLTDQKCNEKTESLKRAIMKFPLTIVEDCEEDIVQNIWKVEESWMNDVDFSKARNMYRLVEQPTSTTLWYLRKLPLVVRVDASNEKIIKSVMEFLRRDAQDKKIVLVGKVSRTDFEDWETLESLWDVVEIDHFSDIMQKLHISFQGRGRIALEDLVKADEDAAKLIRTRELLQMSQQEHLLVGSQKEELPELHIPRFIFPDKSTNEAVKETEIFTKLKDHLFVLCAPPGMGKSRLMQVLYNTCPSDSLAVYVGLINHNSFLATQPDFEAIRDHFLETEATERDLFKQLKKHFWQRRKLYMFLDGLDEINSEHVECILNFVKQASSQGVNVWLSSRENLRESIRQVLNVVPIDIKELSEEEQREYINNKLTESYTSEKIGNIILAIFSSTDLTKSKNLLGIPLQLHILTEMFINDRQVFENLERKNFFVLTQMYKVFFEGKIRFALDKFVDKNQQPQLGNVKSVLLPYEILALKACLSPMDYQKLNLKDNEDKDFLHQLKTEGDKYGIIKRITENDEIIFNHQTYAEYFAAVWFKKNTEKIGLLKDRIFSSKYENLRLIFDIMLAEDNPLHLAIIYQDTDQFENHTGDVDRRDAGGRTACHLAFSYGQKYDRYFNFYKEVNKRETPCYVKMIEFFLQKGKLPDEKDTMFGFDCVSYALQSTCLYPIEILLEKKLLNFDEIKTQLYRYYNLQDVVGYSVRFGFPNLLSGCIKENTDQSENLIKFAIIGCEGDDAPTTDGNAEAVRILTGNRAPLYGMLDTACRYKRFNMLKVLIENGATLNESDRNTILHILVRDCPEKYSEEMASAIEKCQLNVDARDSRGAAALHEAAESADSKILEALIENGGDLNATDDEGQSALHYATRKLRADIIELLLNRGSAVNSQDSNGKTALHLASERGESGIVETLLNHRADPELTDDKKENGLHYASRLWDDSSDTILLLIGKGLNVNQQNEDGETPLHLACRSGHLKNVENLLNRGANPNIEDNKGENALHHVVMRGQHHPVMRRNEVFTHIKGPFELLMKKEVDVNAQNHEGTTALHKAAAFADLETVEALERNGADLNISDYNGRGIFHYASINFREDVIKSVFGRGLPVDAQDVNGVAPIHLASQEGNGEIVKLLLEHGANPKLLDNEDNSALHYASKSKYGNGDIIGLFKSRDLDVNAKNKDGHEPIYFAYMEGNLNNLHKLIEAGAKEDVNAKFENQETPLHLVCKRERSHLSTELLEKGADPNSVDSHQRNPLHYHLLEFYDKDLVHQMIKHGVNLNTRYADGQALLHIVCLHGDYRNVRELLEKRVDVNVLNDERQNPLQVVIRSLKQVNKRLFDDLCKCDDFIHHLHESETYEFGCRGCYTELLTNLMLNTNMINFMDNGKQKFFEIVGRKKRVDLFVNHMLKLNFETDFANAMVCIVGRFIIFELVNYLLKNGSAVNEVDSFNKTAIDYASESKELFPEIVDLLRKQKRLQRLRASFRRFRFN